MTSQGRRKRTKGALEMTRKGKGEGTKGVRISAGRETCRLGNMYLGKRCSVPWIGLIFDYELIGLHLLSLHPYGVAAFLKRRKKTHWKLSGSNWLGKTDRAKSN